FGAHALKQRLPSDLLAIFETGARYQMYHALALVLVGVLASRSELPGRLATPLQLAGGGFVVGTLLFSGSLYVLALSGQRWLGAITPLGGLAFLAGWLALAWAGWLQR
ncbi:MAG TPA: DUF423 domain-containing protein, partial [Pseudomonadota bacterium]|nr:DUF423 domain-containing protein [Pseudomonadota bacterium]